MDLNQDKGMNHTENYYYAVDLVEVHYFVFGEEGQKMSKV